jgi:hypothetical protein
MDLLRAACRGRHLSPRTEEAYCHWARRFIVHSRMQHPATLGPDQVAGFLTTLATRDHVSASTQNQALSALLFLTRMSSTSRSVHFPSSHASARRLDCPWF